MSRSRFADGPVPVFNTAIVVGQVGGSPARRELPSGSVVLEFSVTTVSGDATTAVPVAWLDPPARDAAAVVAGHPVVVVGQMRRRFFRAGGVTASRTELVAGFVARVTSRARLRAQLAETLTELEELAGQLTSAP